jgi:phosphopantetheinyl transferase
MLGWHTRRYQMKAYFFHRVREVEVRLLSEAIGGLFVIFADQYDTANMREYLALRVLNQDELLEYEALPPRRKRQWLNGRIAAKDAVRQYLWIKHGRRILFPKELAISNSPQGQPCVRPHITQSYEEPLHISISHKGLLAAAIAGPHPVGIDVETIEPRSESFLALAFSPEELALLPDNEREEWLARAWAAKEAAGKVAGTGLSGNPRAFRIEDIRGWRICVNGLWIETAKYGDCVIAYKGEGA